MWLLFVLYDFDFDIQHCHHFNYCHICSVKYCFINQVCQNLKKKRWKNSNCARRCINGKNIVPYVCNIYEVLHTQQKAQQSSFSDTTHCSVLLLNIFLTAWYAQTNFHCILHLKEKKSRSNECFPLVHLSNKCPNKCPDKLSHQATNFYWAIRENMRIKDRLYFLVVNKNEVHNEYEYGIWTPWKKNRHQLNIQHLHWHICTNCLLIF